MEKDGIIILLIEDNSGDALLLHELLEDCPFRCHLTVANRLSKALDRIREGRVDLVLMDLNLPDGQGVDAVRQVRQACPEVPLIIHSGSFSGNAEDSLDQVGAVAYLRKGKYGIDELCSVISAATGRARDYCSKS